MSFFASVKRAAIVAALGVTAITQLEPLSVGAADKVTLTGAGSTFDAPLFTKAFSEYTKSVNPNVQVNYGGGGSARAFRNSPTRPSISAPPTAR